jgi:protocatechuate 3,4-dioxygenase beta subunit
LLSDPLPVRELRTDAGGRFDFGQLAPRDYVLAASVPGKLGAIRRLDLRDPLAEREIELVLQDCSASLYGKVVDASGTPIEGAHVTREGVIGVETNRTGDYEVCVLPTAALVAELRVIVRADGFGTITRPLAPTGRMHQDFVLAPEATIAGRVIAPDGGPVADARVAIDVTGPDARVPPEYGVSLTSITDDQGRFRIAGLAAGEYNVAAKSANAVTPTAVVKVEATETTSVELRTSATGPVRGRVLSRGVPIGGVTVSAGSEIAISQSDGSFVLARVPVGDIALETTPYKRTSGPIHVVAGDDKKVDLIVEPMGGFVGTVRRHGAPVPFARVDIAGPSRAGVTADQNGRYEARGLEPGKYGFYCDDRRRGAMFVEEDVELGRGESREHDVELAWGGAIAGRVVNAHGDPVPDVEVSFRGGTASECTTDATGAFVCGGLRGGTYVASVRPTRAAAHPFRFVDAPPPFELRDGDARVDNARLTVDAALSRIAGTVTDGSGSPIPDVTVRAFAVDLTQRTNFHADLSAVSDGDGQFRINDVSAGDYFVEAESRGFATRSTATAGTTSVSLVLDRAPCDGARGHDVPSKLTRPPAPVVWNNRIELIGWSLPSQGQTKASIELTLVFHAAKRIERDWRIFAHFDSQTMRVNADHEPAIGWCPTSEWRVDETIVDHIPVRFDTAGRYALTVGFFTGNAPSWENLTISAAPAAMENTSQTGVLLGDVSVR